MNHQPTAQQKSQFNKSLGTGIKSVFSGKGRKYYVLEHRTASAKHKAGEVQEIIVDYVEIGRDQKCQVRFGEDQQTVSRRHAAITADGDKWVIKNLSESNPTLVNGRAVSKQWFLEHGDEIQLSVEGPKMGFILPPNNTVNSIGLSKRLSLFRQQALRPYKKALNALALTVIVAIGVMSFFLWQSNQKTKELEQETANLKVALDSTKALSQREIDSLVAEMQRNKARYEQDFKNISTLSRSYARPPAYTGGGAVASEEFSTLFPNVYFITIDRIDVTLDGETQYVEDLGSGSGFLLSDGRFITARHVVEPWLFASEGEDLMLTINNLQSIGADVVCTLTATSPDGSSFQFTNKDMKTDNALNRTVAYVDNEGEELLLTICDLGYTDWASYQKGGSGLAFDNAKSSSLGVATELDVLGYPLGLQAHDGSNINPIYGSCKVSAAGLQDGIIMVSARNFEHGNSGGPVFLKVDGKFYVIGIISAGAGDAVGFIVPISATR